MNFTGVRATPIFEDPAQGEWARQVAQALLELQKQARLVGTVDTSDLEDRITALESADTVLDGRVDTAEADIATAEGDIVTLDGRVDTAESDITAAEASIAALLLHFKEYAVISLAATQSGNVNVNDHIEFDTLTLKGGLSSSHITLSTGSDQADGTITLKGARRWLLFVDIGCAVNEGVFDFQWRNGSGGAVTDETGLAQRSYRAFDGVASDLTNPLCWPTLWDATGGNITLELDIVGTNSQTSITGGSRVYAFAL